jgi:hypothetical protein
VYLVTLWPRWVVWCGVVWCGVVWCGVVWCGVVWCGVVWCGVVWCGVVWCGVVWCGVVWCGVLRLHCFTPLLCSTAHEGRQGGHPPHVQTVSRREGAVAGHGGGDGPPASTQRDVGVVFDGICDEQQRGRQVSRGCGVAHLRLHALACRPGVLRALLCTVDCTALCTSSLCLRVRCVCLSAVSASRTVRFVSVMRECCCRNRGAEDGGGTLQASLKALQREKRALQLQLRKYEDEFFAANGRKVKYQKDIFPVADDYQRYKVRVCVRVYVCACVCMCVRACVWCRR